MLPEEVINSLGKHGIPVGKSSLVAGVSGGIDSMVMLALLHELGYTVTVVHVNYHTRGKSSYLDEDLVRKTAKVYGFGIRVVEVTPDQKQGNFQEWARDIRYAAFYEEMKKQKAGAIAVAHNRDDQVETILFKILHGAGPDSWQGMKIFNDGIIRPLLSISRKEIEKYAQAKNISFREDESNDTSAYARNLIRNEWIPRLDKLVPGWRENLLNIPELSAAYEEAAGRILGQVQSGHDGLNRIKFLELGPGLQKTVIAEYIKTRLDEPDGISRSSLRQIDHLQDLKTGKKVQLNKDVMIIRDRERFIVIREPREPVQETTVELEQLEKGPVEYGNIRLRLHNVQEFSPKPGILMLDAMKFTWPLTLRPWINGDRFQPLGMSGHQKVSDHLANRKVDASRKKNTIVAVSYDRVICAVIFPELVRQEPGTMSEIVKCDPVTDKVLTIEQISG